MTLFQNFNFMASINNLIILAIVAVLPACSYDCSLSFWELIESSPLEISKPDRDPGPQRKINVLAVLEVPSVAKVFQALKCMEIEWRDVRGIGCTG